MVCGLCRKGSGNFFLKKCNAKWPCEASILPLGIHQKQLKAKTQIFIHLCAAQHYFYWEKNIKGEQILHS